MDTDKHIFDITTSRHYHKDIYRRHGHHNHKGHQDMARALNLRGHPGQTVASIKTIHCHQRHHSPQGLMNIKEVTNIKII